MLIVIDMLPMSSLSGIPAAELMMAASSSVRIGGIGVDLSGL